MITIQNLNKIYYGNVQALHNLDLDIPEMGMFGLLGVNGAGKTTLMRILAGLLDPTSGQVCVFGNNVTAVQDKRAIKAQLGYLPQDFGVYPDLCAREFLDYIAILKGVTNKVRRQRQIDEVLDAVRLTDVAERRLKAYSGGMKQRVGIAQALLGNPKLLIVDEPTAGLDPEERVRVRNLLADIAQNCAVILSTHIVEDIGQSCSDMAVLWQGTVLFRGTPDELVAQARDKVWIIRGHNGQHPKRGLVTISTWQTQEGVLHRVLGSSICDREAMAVEPRLEDGYLWLMRQARSQSQETAEKNVTAQSDSKARG